MKKVGVPATPLSSALATSWLMRETYSRRRSSSRKRSTSSPRSVAYRARSRGASSSWWLSRMSYISPGLALGRGRLGRLRRQLRAGVDVVEREVAPHVAHVVAVRTEQLADDALSLPAVRTLEVAVLDERHRRVVGAANVVAVGVDLIDQVEDVVGGAPNLAGSD